MSINRGAADPGVQSFKILDGHSQTRQHTRSEGSLASPSYIVRIHSMSSLQQFRRSKPLPPPPSLDIPAASPTAAAATDTGRDRRAANGGQFDVSSSSGHQDGFEGPVDRSSDGNDKQCNQQLLNVVTSLPDFSGEYPLLTMHASRCIDMVDTAALRSDCHLDPAELSLSTSMATIKPSPFLDSLALDVVDTAFGSLSRSPDRRDYAYTRPAPLCLPPYCDRSSENAAPSGRAVLANLPPAFSPSPASTPASECSQPELAFDMDDVESASSPATLAQSHLPYTPGAFSPPPSGRTAAMVLVPARPKLDRRASVHPASLSSAGYPYYSYHLRRASLGGPSPSALPTAAAAARSPAYKLSMPSSLQVDTQATNRAPRSANIKVDVGSEPLPSPVRTRSFSRCRSTSALTDVLATSVFTANTFATNATCPLSLTPHQKAAPAEPALSAENATSETSSSVTRSRSSSSLGLLGDLYPSTSPPVARRSASSGLARTLNSPGFTPITGSRSQGETTSASSTPSQSTATSESSSRRSSRAASLAASLMKPLNLAGLSAALSGGAKAPKSPNTTAAPSSPSNIVSSSSSPLKRLRSATLSYLPLSAYARPRLASATDVHSQAGDTGPASSAATTPESRTFSRILAPLTPLRSGHPLHATGVQELPHSPGKSQARLAVPAKSAKIVLDTTGQAYEGDPAIELRPEHLPFIETIAVSYRPTLESANLCKKLIISLRRLSAPLPSLPVSPALPSPTPRMPATPGALRCRSSTSTLSVRDLAQIHGAPKVITRIRDDGAASINVKYRDGFKIYIDPEKHTYESLLGRIGAHAHLISNRT